MVDRKLPSGFNLPDVSFPDFDRQQRELRQSFIAMNEQQEAIARAARERVHRERQVAAAAEHSLVAASMTVETLADEISEYESKLADHEEVALFVIGGPTGETFFPTILKALNPDKVLYGGADEAGRPFIVIQHVSQLNFAMTATVLAEGQQGRRIGVLIEPE